MTFSVELPKLLGSPTKWNNVDAAERKAFKAGANFQNASNGNYIPRPDTDRRLLDSSFDQPRAAQRQPARSLDNNTYTIEDSVSRRSSVSGLGFTSGVGVADDARSIRSSVSIADSLVGELDRRLAALRQPAGNADEVGRVSSRTSVWSADLPSGNVGQRADILQRDPLGSLFDIGSDFGDGEDRISVSSRDSMLWDTGRLTVELPRLGHRHGGSDASSITTETSLHASKTHGGLLTRIQSAFHRVFQGISNLFRHGEHQKSGTDVVDTSAYLRQADLGSQASTRSSMPVLDSTLGTLTSGRDHLLASIPRLESMLGPRPSGLDTASFVRQFRELEQGVSAFAALARKDAQQGRVSIDISDRLDSLASHATVIADGSTAEQLWVRIRSGDTGFLAESRVRSELNAYVRDVKDEVLNYLAATRNTLLLKQLNSAWGPNTRDAATQTEGRSPGDSDDALSDISADGYSEDAISGYGEDSDSLDFYSGEFSLNDLAETTPKRIGRQTDL